MFINNGVINKGNNNINTVNNDFDYSEIINEINILSKYTNEDLSNIINACDEKNNSKIIELLKKLSKETIIIIKDLGLIVLGKIIEKYIIS